MQFATDCSQRDPELIELSQAAEAEVRWRFPESSGMTPWATVRHFVDRVGSARAGFLIVEPAVKTGDTYRWAQCTGGSRTPLLVEVGFDSGVGIVAPAGAPSAEPVVATYASGVKPRGSVAQPEMAAGQPNAQICACSSGSRCGLQLHAPGVCSARSST